MKIGPKYKIARKLGGNVFEKTQTAKFALSEQKKNQKRWSRPRTNYATQLAEKQKVRFHYGLTEKQLSKYVKQVINSKSKNPAADIFNLLESRLDSIILRSGFARTRFQARQAASHGHFKVNKRKATVPSMKITTKDEIILADSKKESPLYVEMIETIKDVNSPSWISIDIKDHSIKLKNEPVYNQTEYPFDLLSIIQFYKR